MKLDPTQILIAPVVSEKSYHMISARQYCFRVHQDAHKLQVRQAVEKQFGVEVESESWGSDHLDIGPIGFLNARPIFSRDISVLFWALYRGSF